MIDCEIDLSKGTRYNIIMDRDRDLDQPIRAKIYSGDTFIANYDFSPYTSATLSVKVKQQDAYTVLTFSTTDGSIVLSADGLFTLKKTASQVATIKAGQGYYYDMYLTSVQYQKRAFLYGLFKINQNVTQ